MNSPKCFQYEQIIISGNDDIRFACNSRRKHDIIIFIAANRVIESDWCYDLSLFMQSAQKRQLVRLDSEVGSQRAG